MDFIMISMTEMLGGRTYVVLVTQSTEVSEPRDRAGGRQLKAGRILSPSL